MNMMVGKLIAPRLVVITSHDDLGLQRQDRWLILARRSHNQPATVYGLDRRAGGN